MGNSEGNRPIKSYGNNTKKSTYGGPGLHCNHCEKKLAGLTRIETSTGVLVVMMVVVAVVVVVVIVVYTHCLAESKLTD